MHISSYYKEIIFYGNWIIINPNNISFVLTYYRFIYRFIYLNICIYRFMYYYVIENKFWNAILDTQWLEFLSYWCCSERKLFETLNIKLLIWITSLKYYNMYFIIFIFVVWVLIKWLCLWINGNGIFSANLGFHSCIVLYHSICIMCS